MAYQVLARKYRPLRFSDVVGQDHVTRTLLNALAQDRIAHGYIFSGHRGIGKTTIARILASALNCQNPIGSDLRPTPEPCLVCNSCLEIRSGNAVDVLEIDAATNRGIDEIRELRDAARYRPARDRFKIIILDEAHQITDPAFNALLKTLEEPPEHIVFMMATTQPEDIPQTIRSRCQHFSFHAVKLDEIVGQLRKISTDENIDVDDATLGLLAEAGDGSMRDALSIMDQAIASAPTASGGRPHVELTEVRSLMGAVSNVVFEETLAAVHNNDSATVLSVLGTLLDAGNGAQQIARQFVRFLRNCVVAKVTGLTPQTDATGIAAELLQISAEERIRAAKSAQNFTEEELSRFLSILLRTFDDLGYRQEQRLHLELGLLKLVHVQRLVPVEEILSQLGGNTPPRPSPAPAPQNAAASSSAQRPSAPPQPQKPSVPPSPTASSSTKIEASPAESTPAPAPPARTSAGTAAPASTRPLTAATTPDTQNTPPAAPYPPHTTEFSKPQTPATPFTPAPPESGPSVRNDLRSSVPRASAATPAGSTPPEPAPVQASGTAGTPCISEAGGWDAPTSAPAPAEPPPQTPDSTARPDISALQSAIIATLAATKGQSSASEQLEDATWILSGNTIEIQTTLSRTMLPVLINPEADRIIKTVLRNSSAGQLQIKLLPGAPAANGTEKKSKKPPAAGSAAELAEKHPLVQEAKRLFQAEISNVIDLRDKE